MTQDKPCPVPSGAQSKAADLIRWFPSRLAKLQNLYCRYRDCEESCSLAVQKYGEFHPSTGNVPDPVARRYSEIETIRAVIGKVERDVLPLQEVYSELKNSQDETEREMFLVFDQHVKDGASMQDISDASGIPVRTLYRRKSELGRRVFSAWREWQK